MEVLTDLLAGRRAPARTSATRTPAPHASTIACLGAITSPSALTSTAPAALGNLAP